MIGWMKKMPVMSPAPFCKVEKFSTRSAQNGHTKKVECSAKDAGRRALFSRQPLAAADALPLLRTIEKRHWRSEKNTAEHNHSIIKRSKLRFFHYH